MKLWWWQLIFSELIAIESIPWIVNSMWFLCSCQYTTKLALKVKLSVLSEAIIPGFYSLLIYILPYKNGYILSTCGKVIWVQDSAVWKRFDISSGLKLWLICCLSFDSESTTAWAVEIMLMLDCILCALLAWYGSPVHTQLPFTARGVSYFKGLEEWRVTLSNFWMGTTAHHKITGF